MCMTPRRSSSVSSESARPAGNDVAQLVFEGAAHGGGGVNCVAGRAATLAFLRHHALLRAPAADDDAADADGRGDGDDTDPADAIGGAMRAFDVESREYAPRGDGFRPAEHGRATIRFKPL